MIEMRYLIKFEKDMNTADPYGDDIVVEVQYLQYRYPRDKGEWSTWRDVETEYEYTN